MIVCSKCKIEKDNKEYYTYYHSTQQTLRTRKVCQECCAKQKKNYKLRIRQEKLRMKEILTQPEKVAVIAPELQPDLFKDNPLYKFCKNCNQYKLLTEYYPNKKINGYATWCKICHNGHQHQKQREYYDNKFKNNGGSERILATPGKYVDIYQKEQAFWILELMGWKYNENGVWSKEGIKDKDKNWPNVNKAIKKPKDRKKQYPLTTLTCEAIIEYRKDNLTFDEIGKLYNVSGAAIRIKLSKYERQD